MGAALSQTCGRLCWSEAQVQALANREKADSAQVGGTVAQRHLTEQVPAKKAHFVPLRPTPPPKVRPTGPITLATVQGQWLSGNGTAISVVGTAVHMNGVPLRNQKVELREDGTVSSIGSRLQVDTWTDEGGIQFFACEGGGQNMEFASKEVWTPLDSPEARDEKLRALGYAGTAASFDSGTRGVDGCIPGTLDQYRPPEKYEKVMQLLQSLVLEWREPELCNVHSCNVVPDFINRENTGVGVELVHYIAISIRDTGFKKRQGRSGHDVPVVVREPSGSDSHKEALRAWKEKVAEEEGFPPVQIRDDEAMFTSLGNSHFFQALNLHKGQCAAINDSGRYVRGNDAALDEALTQGVPSLVLKSTTPRPVRAKISVLLNSKMEFRWTLKSDGTLDVSKVEENTTYTNQFEAMSKQMDSVVLNSLVRSHLGVKESKRQQG